MGKNEKDNLLNILFIADIVGKPGLDITSRLLSGLLEKHRIHFCLANGENAAFGKGLTESIARQFFSLGINVITTGNHIWDKREGSYLLKDNPRILRPLNYPPGNRGAGSVIFTLKDTKKIAIINLQGRTFMSPVDCPFRTGLKEAKRLKQETNVIIVDFHAEATAEKMALAWYLDGRVSAVIGTHTHVQTADERILPKGTAYITDVGMTGPHDSVLGLRKEIAIERFLLQIPVRYQPAQDNIRFCGVVISIDTDSGKAKEINRLMIP